MSGENFNQQSNNTPQANQWDVLSNYDGPSKFNKPKHEITPLSVAQNTSERVATGTSRIVEGWRKRSAERKAERIDNQYQTMDTNVAKIDQKLQSAHQTAAEWSDSLASAKRDINVLLDSKKNTKEKISDLHSEYNVGNYVKSQVEQAGAILKADSAILRSGLNLFKAKVLNRLPIRMQNPFVTASKVEEGFGLKQRMEDKKEVRGRSNAAEEAKTNFEQAKASRRETINEADAKNKEQIRGFADIAKNMRDLAANRAKLVKAKAESVAVQQRYDIANKRYESVEKSLSAAREERARAYQERAAADKEVGQIQDNLARIESRIQFQHALQNRSPRAVRQNLENQLSNAEGSKDSRLKDMLAANGVRDVTELSPDRQALIKERLAGEESRISLIKDQLSALNQYEDLRTEQANSLASNPTVKRGVGGTFRRMRRMIAATLM